MSFLSLLGISTAQAATTAAATAPATAGHPTGGSLLSMLPMLIAFIAIFYFLMVRPQTKRAKEHRQLMSSLMIGDEVLTSGGVIGRLSKLRDTYVVLTIAKGVEMTFQRNAIAGVLPKGTLESIE
ncbi:MAG: preprotein translocase subunit YajC [Gammaproteobacteria bacterium RIFCSPLOWO2_02_FULL_42_14]|nr:MAG: preprotein translocase subunit YajC [Gammaproteobacteria bacterium RIFCSPHIGHO2_02_FULL_42_43]OGT28330.1 MAG: preprotein translocase subunit YajC [Gammaproteobacteria bacterium RIFCSPHIGHO2_01_FULL_42_8]OGT53703.1 MAG: preprotein translocase subunit YajC [Gammaproteobacteria bacterium RIFCSPHIGHO2_12_FULL_41_25]OGT62767.1 MAG: preprotein translocase subunit YajC [Gammaproteobacteria bacterium RIFCSPLOWO2_02_FULL_42_14]OGT85628.1 MAG: preprotein translocase subunit YajC [Gammaproteobacte